MRTTNVYDGTELANALKVIVNTKEDTKIIFHEDLFGFSNDEIHIQVEIDNFGDYVITTHEVLEGVETKPKTRTMHSDWTFQDYVFAVCGW